MQVFDIATLFKTEFYTAVAKQLWINYALFVTDSIFLGFPETCHLKEKKCLIIGNFSNIIKTV